jgi:hypothetical protein
MPFSVTVARVMAAAKSRNTRMPSVPGGASKCLRYTHSRSQADGSQRYAMSARTLRGNARERRALPHAVSGTEIFRFRKQR